MHKFALFLSAFLLLPFNLRASPIAGIREGDRIVLLGDTFIERAQESGWLETALAARFPGRHFIVRNLGWGGDTPAGISRASFDFTDPEKTFQRLVQQIGEVKPTVIFLGYGMASSFDGKAGLEKFKSDLNRLVDAVNGASPTPIRWIILSPIRHEKLPSPLPDPAAHNAELALYVEALREVAGVRAFPFVNLFHWNPRDQAEDVTDDGIHLTSTGYRLVAEEILRQLGWDFHFSPINPQLIEQLRQTVVAKDQLFFDRWRPQNETYLFGFRKHEQGQNAPEIPRFDPLIEAQEEQIHQLQALIGRSPGGAPPTKMANILPANPKKVASLPMPDFEVAPGFAINLWAEYPMLSKPTQINFDPQGRLWVASSSLYPQIAPGQKPDDRIIVLEDTQGLGKADKSTVFAHGLFIPTAVEPGDGGCYVAQSTELLHFDTGSDGKATNRRVVLSGFGTEDTHHLVHTLAWGPDGMLYFDQSIYIHSHLETPNGVVRLNSGGVYHLRPPTMELGVFLRGFCNPWGHQFDSFGQSFVTDGAGFEGISWGIDGATYFSYANMRREMQSISPGSYPKFCGLEIVASEQFPQDWQGDFLTEDFRAHKIVHFRASEEGAGYVTRELPVFLQSRDETFRPIDLKFGPDGALYVADWANPIINHGEVDFRDPRRDHEHGRIWRITAKDRPLNAVPHLLQASNEKLFEELLSPNGYNARQARRVLTERGISILPDLQQWTARQSSDKALLQALWMYQSINVRNDTLLDRVLQAADGHVRAAAARVLQYWPRFTSSFTANNREVNPSDSGGLQPDACYARALNDPFPRVRVEALRAIARIPSLRSAELALETLNEHMDPFLDYALWLTINDLAKPWLAGLQSGAWKPEGREKQLEFALRAIEPELLGEALHKILATHPLNRDAQPWMVDLVGSGGQEGEVASLYEKLLNNELDAAASSHAWTALNEAASSRHVKPGSGLEKIIPFLDSPDQTTKIQAIKLAGNWKAPDAALPRLLDLAGGRKTPSTVRRAVFESLREMGGAQTVETMHSLAAKGNAPEVRREAALTLASLDAAHCGAAVVGVLADTTSQQQAQTLWRSLLNNRGAAESLADALPRQGFPTVAGKAGLLAIRESGQAEPQLILALSRAANLQTSQAALTPQEMAELADTVRKQGDPARGERIFRRPQQSCLNCHAIGGVGAKVGPDLTSLGASAQLDYIIESVFYPNKQIKEGYNSFLVDTTDGEVLSGNFVRENTREYVIRSAGDQETVIPRSRIRSIKPGGSLMPSGLIDALTSQEQIDLFRFLSELGKPGSFDASKANVARCWKAAAAARLPEPGRDAQFSEGLFTGAAWHPVASLVSGQLLREDAQTAAGGGDGEMFIAAKFRTVGSGSLSLRLSPPGAARAWVDGKSASFPLRLEVPSGIHDIVLEIDPRVAPDSLRLSSDEATFLSF